ncbi:MAG: helix-turn-helix domain-containing protein [Alistipes sp.]|nr:helix-turn-helix domain-containing protein [Alistipes sp.]
MAENKNRDLAITISSRLKEVRRQKGIKQEEVIFDLGINIGRLETGENIVTLPTLRKLCEYYGITFE